MNEDIHKRSSSKSWMRWCMVAAGAYNILWGAAASIAPVTSLKLLGVNPATTELWPNLWACIGMIVGVYGIGYFIAAADTARHWPIVLVGLLGKILGPIGFLKAAIQGQLPWSMGVTILTNDLIWWIPFTMILWNAIRAAQPPPPGGAVTLDEALDTLRDLNGKTLRDITDERQTLVVLLRHSGCTFCKQTLSDLSKWQGDINSAGVGIAVVGMSASNQKLIQVGDQYGLKLATWFADPDRLLYRALEVRRGTFLQLFGPRVWVGGILAMLRGHGVGKLDGDGFQMPGAFVIYRGGIIRAYRHRTAADRPDLKELSCPIN